VYFAVKEKPLVIDEEEWAQIS
jgi:calcium-dependent protein kinase